MQVSLLDRFHGGLLGTWIAASLNQETNYLLEIDEQLLPGIKIALRLTDCLIELGEIPQEKWLEIWQQEANQLKVSVALKSGAIALMTLPLALFSHDAPHQFKEYLYSLNQEWQQPEETLKEVILWQEAIALILQEKVQIKTLIPQLLKSASKPWGTNSACQSTFLEEQLKQVQTLINKKIPLSQAVSQLSRCERLHPHEMALAYYCFSYTPKEFSVSVKRAKSIGLDNSFPTDYQPSLTAALTGILAGVYNGLSGTPIAWRGELQNRKISQKIYRQATHLFAVWSGVDQSGRCSVLQPGNAELVPHLSLQPLQYTAIACPSIIQSRIAPRTNNF